MSDPDRLPDVPRIHCYLVEAELEDVLGYCRGEATASRLSDEADPVESPYYKFSEIHELTGEAAGIDRPFAPETSYLAQFPRFASLSSYPLRGWRRVSQVRSNPRFVLWEGHFDSVRPMLETELQVWTGGACYLFFSQIAPYPGDQELLDCLHINFPAGAHGLIACDAERMRKVVYSPTESGRKRFWQKGPTWGFEDTEAYETLPPRHRLTRNRLCTYLERLGVDPEATFGRRELDNPVLFTTDHEGVSASRFPDLAERYCRQHEESLWTQKIIEGKWF